MAEAFSLNMTVPCEDEESNVRDPQPLPKHKIQSATETFFASLNELGKKLDTEVSELESKVSRQVSRALSSNQDGEFAAPIADDIHDELQELNRLDL